MYSFENDYSEGAHPRVMARLMETNLRQTTGYGMDEDCAEARALIARKLCHPESEIHFMIGGTQTNVTVIAHLLKPYQGVVSPDTGHINVHESGAVEATGHKVLPIPAVQGKITAAQVDELVSAHYADPTASHMVQPGMLYLSQPTEVGTVYSKAELEAMQAACRKHGMYFYIDGARLAAALAAEGNDCSLADLARLCDAFYIGGTKLGLLMGEALVLNNPAIQKDFRYMMKHQAGLLAKGRLLGVQFAELFRDGLYEEIGRHEVGIAQHLAKELKSRGYAFLAESPTNQIFPILPDELLKKLESRYRWSFWAKTDDSHTAVRLCTSWATPESAAEDFLKDLDAARAEE